MKGFWIAFLGANTFMLAGVAPAAAQTDAPVAPASPVAAPTATPLPITGPVYGSNDPCTSIAAIISRPSVTTSVCTVRPGHVLIESGYANTSADATSTTVGFPQATLRIGTVIPALELDLGVPTYQRVNAGGALTSGFTDVGAGLKYILGYSPRFNYGANVFITEPTGSNSFSAGASTQQYNLNFGYTINSVFSLAGTLGYNALASGSGRYTSFVPSLVLTAGLPNATGLFVETAGFTHGAGPATSTRLQVLGGITRGLSARLQVDLEAGRSATIATGKYRFIGFGASYYL